MLTVHNLTKSPFDLPGGHILPANGSWTGELPEAYLLALRASPTVRIDEPDDMTEEFRAEYERLSGKRPDRRWSMERLIKEIEALEK